MQRLQKFLKNGLKTSICYAIFYLTKIFLKILNQLSKIGVNINQIAHNVNGLGKFDKTRYEQEANLLHQMVKDLKIKYL